MADESLLLSTFGGDGRKATLRQHNAEYVCDFLGGTAGAGLVAP